MEECHHPANTPIRKKTEQVSDGVIPYHRQTHISSLGIHCEPWQICGLVSLFGNDTYKRQQVRCGKAHRCGDTASLDRYETVCRNSKRTGGLDRHVVRYRYSAANGHLVRHVTGCRFYIWTGILDR